MITRQLEHLAVRCFRRGYTLEEVRPCIISQDGDEIIVDENYLLYPKEYKLSFISQQPIKKRAGTDLKKLLEKIGIKASPSC